MEHYIKYFCNSDGELDFKKLYDALEEQVSLGMINKKEKGSLCLYDYSRQCQFDAAWNPATRISRGLIIDTDKECVVALPLEKFFNYGGEHREHGREIGDPRWKGVEIHEKMDGSLGICWFYEDEWHVSTRGSFDSDQAVWATEWLHENVDTTKMSTKLTYIFEIIYHENQIVVNYDYEGLVLLTLNNRETFHELECIPVDLLTLELSNVKRPTFYKFDKISDAVSWVKTLPKDQEGVVVKFSSGVRVKIKGDEYCRIHKILAHHSPLVVWENFRDKGLDFIKEYKLNIPEEFWDETDDWVSYFRGTLLRISSEIRSHAAFTQDLSNKELGLILPKMIDSPEYVRKFLFSYRKNPCPSYNTGEPCVMFSIGSKERKKVFDMFKPSGNVIACQ